MGFAIRFPFVAALAVVLLSIGAPAAHAEPQACCFELQPCAEFEPAVCIAGLGTPQGPGTTCADDPCTPRACCGFGELGCEDVLPSECLEFNGTPAGQGELCETDPCGVEACCAEDGTCVNRPAVACLNNGDTPAGPGTLCVGDNDENGVDDACEASPIDVAWIGAAGNYLETTKWSLAGVPCNFGLTTYNVAIPGSDDDVTYDDFVCSVRSLTLGPASTFRVQGSTTYTIVESATLPGNLHVEAASLFGLAGINLNGADVLVADGEAVLAATAYGYTATAPGDGRTLRASGPSALLDLATILSISLAHVGAPAGAALTIEALDGGTIDLGSVATISGGAVVVRASGADSEINLGGVTSIVAGNPGTPSLIEPLSGGTVILGLATTLDGVDINANGTGFFNPAALTSYLRGVATATGGVLDLDAVTTTTGSTFAAGGGDISLAALTSASSATFNVSSGQVLAPNLASLSSCTVNLSGTGDFGLADNALLSGSTLNWSGGGFSLADNLRLTNCSLTLGTGLPTPFAFTFEGSGSWSGGLPAGLSALIHATTSTDANMTAGAAFVNGGVLTFATDSPSREARLTVTSGGVTNGSTGQIRGRGRFALGNQRLTNNGLIAPGAASPGDLTITGRFTQNSGGRLEIDVAGSSAGQFDRLLISSTATLGGTLAVTLAPGFVPSLGTSLTVLTTSGRTGTFGSTQLPTLTAPDCAAVEYSPTAVQFIVTRAGIAAQPQGQSVCTGAVVTLSVTPASIGAYTYQWRKNGGNLPGATSSTLVLGPVTLADAGTYDVIVTNACGSVTSAPAMVSVAPAPKGDFNGSCDVEAADRTPFLSCVAGPAGALGAGCALADFDDDGDVDLGDYARFQAAFGE